MLNIFEVVKRDGKVEPFNPDKINKVIEICIQGLNIDLNKYKEKLSIYLKPKMTTEEIQQNLINAAISLVANEENKLDYSKFAARLMLIDFRKKLRTNRCNKYGGTLFDIKGRFKKFKTFWKDYLIGYLIDELGLYDERFKKIPYTIAKDLYEELILNENKDILFENATHVQVQKLINSYIITYDNKPLESIEEMFFLQSLIGFLPSVIHYGCSWNKYKEKVKKHFNYLINFLIIPATPQLLNLRRKNPNISSCFILDVNDNTESICHTQTQIAQISRNAGGVGLYLGKIRPSGSWIKGNPNLSNPISDWIKLFEVTTYNWNQMGKRKGAVTVSLPIWHKDIFHLLESIDLDIGNPARKSPEVFPQVVIPTYFFKYLSQKKSFYLIDLHEITNILGYKDLDLNDVYGEEEERRYNEIVKLIESGKVKNYIKINPKDILKKIFYYWNRKGLPYISFKDNVNKYSPYNEELVIYSTNLCTESFSPFKNTNPKDPYCIKDEELGYIHTCNITNINLRRLYEEGYLPLGDNDNLNTIDKLKEFLKHIYEYMDNLLEIQNIPIKESREHNKLFRTVTLGFIGLGDVFVKYSLDNNKYVGYLINRRGKGNSIDTKYIIDKVFGTIGFLAHLVSSELAKERGAPPMYHSTKIKENGLLFGRFRIDKDKNKIVYLIGEENYNKLKNNIYKYGLRNTLLLTCPPNTSTSLVAHSTAGILPTYSLTQIEDQKTGLFVNFVYYYENGKFLYDVYSRHFMEIQDYLDLIEVVAHIQQYIDSGISFEITINHNYFNTPEKLTRLYIEIIKNSVKKGIKTIYYIRHILPDKIISGESKCESCAN